MMCYGGTLKYVCICKDSCRTELAYSVICEALCDGKRNLERIEH
jgi:hypothetical protein